MTTVQKLWLGLGGLAVVIVVANMPQGSTNPPARLPAIQTREAFRSQQARIADSIAIARVWVVDRLWADEARADSLLRWLTPASASGMTDHEVRVALNASRKKPTFSRQEAILVAENDRRYRLVQEWNAGQQRMQAAERADKVSGLALSMHAQHGRSTSPPTRSRVELVISKHPNWSDDMLAMVSCRMVGLGMTTEQIRASWGSPEDINRTVGSWGVHEQWVYHSPYGPYVYIEDGVVTSWQD